MITQELPSQLPMWTRGNLTHILQDNYRLQWPQLPLTKTKKSLVLFVLFLLRQGVATDWTQTLNLDANDESSNMWWIHWEFLDENAWIEHGIISFLNFLQLSPVYPFPKPCTVQLLAVQAATDWVSVLAVRFGEFPHATF